MVTQHVIPWSGTLRDRPKISCKRMYFNCRCGRKGHCLEYDHDGLALVVLSVFVTCKLITTICFFLSWFFCRRLQAKEKVKDAYNEEGGKGGASNGGNEKEFLSNQETTETVM